MDLVLPKSGPGWGPARLRPRSDPPSSTPTASGHTPGPPTQPAADGPVHSSRFPGELRSDAAGSREATPPFSPSVCNQNR